MAFQPTDGDFNPLLTLARISTEQSSVGSPLPISQNGIAAMQVDAGEPDAVADDDTQTPFAGLPPLPEIPQIGNLLAPQPAPPPVLVLAESPAPMEGPQEPMVGAQQEEEQPWRSVYLDQNRQLKPNNQINLEQIDFAHLKRCVSKQQAEAEFDFASCSRYGLHVNKPSMRNAFTFLKKSGSHGLPIAHWVLYQYLTDDKISDQVTAQSQHIRYKHAVEYLKKAAQAGFIVAQYDLALVYKQKPEYFRGQERLLAHRKVQAFRWFETAAENGYPPAEWGLAVCYDQDYGVPQEKRANCKEFAQKYYALAKEHGYQPEEHQEDSKQSKEAAAQAALPMEDDKVFPEQNGVPPASNNNSSSNNGGSSAVQIQGGLTIDLTLEQEANGKAVEEMEVEEIQAPVEQAQATLFYFKKIADNHQKSKASLVDLRKQQAQHDEQQKQIEFYRRCIAKQNAQLQNLENERTRLNNEGASLEKSLEGNEMLKVLAMPQPGKSPADNKEEKEKLEKILVQSLAEQIQVQKQQGQSTAKLKQSLHLSSAQKAQEVKLMKESLTILMNKKTLASQALVRVESEIDLLNTMKDAAVESESIQDALAQSSNKRLKL